MSGACIDRVRGCYPLQGSERKWGSTWVAQAHELHVLRANRINVPWLFALNLPLGALVLLASRASPDVPDTGRTLHFGKRLAHAHYLSQSNPTIQHHDDLETT